MTFTVWHNPNPTFRNLSDKEIFDLRVGSLRFVEVATVEADTVEDVYRLSQNIEDSWLTNPGVTPAKGVTRARSTSVGDVIEDDSLGFFAVQSFGFRSI
jgi:hypothetical protein